MRVRNKRKYKKKICGKLKLLHPHLPYSLHTLHTYRCSPRVSLNDSHDDYNSRRPQLHSTVQCSKHCRMSREEKFLVERTRQRVGDREGGRDGAKVCGASHVPTLTNILYSPRTHRVSRFSRKGRVNTEQNTKNTSDHHARRSL